MVEEQQQLQTSEGFPQITREQHQVRVGRAEKGPLWTPPKDHLCSPRQEACGRGAHSNGMKVPPQMPLPVLGAGDPHCPPRPLAPCFQDTPGLCGPAPFTVPHLEPHSTASMTYRMYHQENKARLQSSSPVLPQLPQPSCFTVKCKNMKCLPGT